MKSKMAIQAEHILEQLEWSKCWNITVNDPIAVTFQYT